MLTFLAGWVVAAAGLTAAIVWLRRASRTFDRHVDQALAVARHPTSVERVLGLLPDGCECGHDQPDLEAMDHNQVLCQPLREVQR